MSDVTRILSAIERGDENAADKLLPLVDQELRKLAAAGTDGTQVYRVASRGKLDDAFSRLDACEADEDLITLTKHYLKLDPKDRPRDADVLAQRVTGYLESVESTLRKMEVERAAEAAQAIAGRKRMRVTMALAASVRIMLNLWWRRLGVDPTAGG